MSAGGPEVLPLCAYCDDELPGTRVRGGRDESLLFCDNGHCEPCDRAEYYEVLVVALEAILEGSCGSAYGSGCDTHCQTVAGHALAAVRTRKAVQP